MVGCQLRRIGQISEGVFRETDLECQLCLPNIMLALAVLTCQPLNDCSVLTGCKHCYTWMDTDNNGPYYGCMVCLAGFNQDPNDKNKCKEIDDDIPNIQHCIELYLTDFQPIRSPENSSQFTENPYTDAS